MITSAYVDHSTQRLVISGQNLATVEASGRMQNAHPLVTLDLQPMVVESVDRRTKSWSRRCRRPIPKGSHLLTVSRGNGAKDSATFVVAIYE